MVTGCPVGLLAPAGPGCEWTAYLWSLPAKLVQICGSVLHTYPNPAVLDSQTYASWSIEAAQQPGCSVTGFWQPSDQVSSDSNLGSSDVFRVHSDWDLGSQFTNEQWAGQEPQRWGGQGTPTWELHGADGSPTRNHCMVLAEYGWQRVLQWVLLTECKVRSRKPEEFKVRERERKKMAFPYGHVNFTQNWNMNYIQNFKFCLYNNIF